MKYIFILLCTTVLISCGSNKTSDASTTDSKTSGTTDPSGTSKPVTEMTDQEKAQIAEQLLAFSSKELEDLKSDDCGTLTKSLHLLYARQTLAEKYQMNADDINQLIGVIETKIKGLNCNGSSGTGPDIDVGIHTSGGGASFQIKLPTDAAIWAVLTVDQRELVLASVPLSTRNQLLEMEAKYALKINQIRETPAVIKVRPVTAYVRPDLQTPAVIVNEKPDAKTQVMMEKNKVDQTKFKKSVVK